MHLYSHSTHMHSEPISPKEGDGSYLGRRRRSDTFNINGLYYNYNTLHSTYITTRLYEDTTPSFGRNQASATKMTNILYPPHFQ